MSPNPTPPPPSTSSAGDTLNLDIAAVRRLVSIITRHMHTVLARNSLKHRCFSNLKIHSQEFFEFSDHSVLSNLYWGVENAEAASSAADERESKLDSAEKMLQIPASLDYCNGGLTLGIPNSYLVCFSYLYLAVVELLRGNEWRAAVHFLQALSICPRIVCNELAPGIWQCLVPVCARHRVEKCLGLSVPLDQFDETMIDDAMRWIAAAYKPWLVYYQIMSAPDSCRTPAAVASPPIIRSGVERSHKQINGARAINLNQPSTRGDVDDVDEKASSNIKYCLKDILTESQPNTPRSLHSHISSTDEESCCSEDQQGEDLNHIASLSWNTRAYYDTATKKTQRQIDGTRATECIPRSFSTSFRPAHSGKNHSRMAKSLSCRTTLPQEDTLMIEQNGVVERIISKLCFTEELGNVEQDYTVEMNTIYEMLSTKMGLKYSLLKDMILDQLLITISTSKEEIVVRRSVSILSTIVTTNRSVVDDIKRKGLQLYDLATALKRNVHEAVILIYLIRPSPVEIKTLELLPCLVEVVCTTTSTSHKVEDVTSFSLLTPSAASLMIIEMLVTAFDSETNSMHLAAITSPRVLSGLLQVPRRENLDELISLASVLAKSMCFDAKCRKYISESSPATPFASLLWSNQERAASTALEFFNELLKMPRSSAIALLEQIQKQGSSNNSCALFLLIQNYDEPQCRILAANLLLQLQVLEDPSSNSVYGDEAVNALFDSLQCEDSPQVQALSSFILANLGGTYSWNGEAYTMAWLVKKTGLILPQHRNLIKTFDFLDQSLQDGGIDSWCSRIAQRILQLGTRVFEALDKGLNSKTRRVSRDSLVATAWLGLELVKGQDELRHAACDILLHSVEQFLHPGFDFEERLVACLCIYNYTSGRGMKRIINLSEGVRESLRRMSNVTWMAEELLKVADYFQPNKWRISCVHNQILEAGTKCSGAVSALIYYKGYLCSGYADGSIKAWDVKGQTMALVIETMEHKKAVTCFSLYEPGNCLLSGSSDKTIKMWQMQQRNLECIEVIPMKESIRSIDSSGELIFATTQSHKLKVIDASRKVRDVFKNKRVKCMRVAQGKVYAGCLDSSIMEEMMVNNRQQEIKGPSKSWMQNKPIRSICLYKDWLYCASLAVEGSKMKEWRRRCPPKITMVPDKGASILAMEVVEDFIYLNCNSSSSSLQIWLRGTQQKVGRLSAGSKITSLLSANDMILCGTEKGVIKGWIPL